ncbi:Fc.00g033600.m01.CDS01 [Cosmosporella sp. VM-42]
MVAKINIAALAFAGAVSALPTQIAQVQDRDVEERAVADVYRFYTGNGSGAAGWPALDTWGSYDEIWNTNQNILQNSCVWNGYGANNSPQEISDINKAIKQVSAEQGVGPRFIMSVILQESKGCVRAPATPSPDGTVRNPGLMQSHNGSGSCAGVNPCPYNSILQMIRDGTGGTSSGDGLKQTLAKTAAATGAGSQRNYFAAARLYNSGSIDYNDLHNAFGATSCYASDIANRLTGWTLANSSCR